MASSSLNVPLAFWANLPTAPVTTVAYKEGHIVTGLEDGHIWIYRCIFNEQGSPQLQHKILCVGHKSSITALTIIKGQTDGCAGNDYVLISASEDGEVIKWGLLDGRCLTAMPKALDGTIKSLKPLAEYSQTAKFLLCSGFSGEITILNCTTLEIVRIWGGHNDWVTCTPFYDSDARQIRLLTSNFNGILKIWTFDESKYTIRKDYDNVGLLDAQGDKILELISNPYDIGVILAITKSYAIVFTIRRGKMVNFQRIRISKEGIYWASGIFLLKNRVLLWSQSGNAYLYSIPSTERKFSPENAHLHIKPSLIRRSSLPNLQKSIVEKLPNSTQSRPQLLEIVCSDNEDITGFAVTTVFALTGIDGKTSSWYLITFRNQINGTSFAFKSLSPTVQEPGICENNYHIRESRWPSETYLTDIWKLKHQNDNITVTTMVYDDYLAIGYERGEIHLIPLSIALVQSDSDAPNSTSTSNLILKLKGHIGRVTCLYTPNSQNFGNKYLLSGGEDCSVRIWNLEGKKLASFRYHSQYVTHFFEPPSDECQRIKKCVISMAKDNSLTIISLEELSCLYVFGGYPYPLNKIQWRISEGFIVLLYKDDSAHIWQIKTLELFQIVKGSAAREMLRDKSWKTSSAKKQMEFITNKTLTSFTDNSENDGITFLQIFTINIKQLINDIYHYHVSQLGSKPNFTNGIIEDFDEKPSTMSKIFSWTTGGAVQSSSVASTSPSAELETKAIDASTVQVIVSTLMTWEIDSSLDKLCAEKLGLKKPLNRVTFGLRGANGNMSFSAPSPDDGAAIWKISQTMTASLLLSIVGLTRSFLSMKGLEKYTSDIITHYGSSLQELVGKQYYHSSLAFHAKYFQDPIEDIRLSARTLFSSALNNMPPSELQSIIDYWKQFLTSPDMYTNQYMARSTILLGMIGADYPKLLSKTVARNIALSLVLLLHDGSKLSHRLAALELCGRGFSTWEPHFDAVAVLNTLFALAIETDTNTASIKAMAQKAIFQISAVNTPLCISTLTCDTIDSTKPAEKSGFLKLISLFIRRKPLVLYTNLSGLVEAVVKSLDPNIPKMRDAVLQTTTSVLHDLVKTFPSVTFHGGSQKLAVGTLEGASIIYDLRTATRWHVLEGHTKPVTAVTFSGDGRLIVSCSLEEGTVRVWNPSPGFLGMIAGSLTNGSGGNSNGKSKTDVAKGFKTPLSSSIKPSKTFGFNLGEDAHLSVNSILESVYFEWAAERTVKLFVKDSIMSFNI
ncbi:WD40-repeat-containing domain protein [Glomus cerebriforme]|uniref:WD40-repeat-containing domain protein n=1 Tax=Glomus cerebriforme TaxID=658196 RepID=A0A397SUG7_9GLOM|nr:WD40-repeat-containing domain protein [Glomus cerebriforme]